MPGVAVAIGPGQPVVDGVYGVDDELGEQPADLLDCQRDQPLATVWLQLLFACGDHGQYGVGEHDQGGVSMPGGPAAELMFVQVDALAGLKRRLDRPAAPRHRDQGT